ncbi:Hydrogen cyanide synthase subunit HcnC [archaeon HR06]|nr:Hydrogen cyanide synthase subunit HcnC [archaeon HR06]
MGFKLPLRPAKGIMVTFESNKLLNTSVVSSKIGLVQNPNLRAGGTVEFVGYDKSIKEETVKFIVEEASKLLPKVKELKIVEKWAGLRPYVDDGLPIIGALPNFSNFLIATGHFKNGFLLSPITGKIISDMIEFGKSIEELSPKRFFKN